MFSGRSAVENRTVAKLSGLVTWVTSDRPVMMAAISAIVPRFVGPPGNVDRSRRNRSLPPIRGCLLQRSDQNKLMRPRSRRRGIRTTFLPDLEQDTSGAADSAEDTR